MGGGALSRGGLGPGDPPSPAWRAFGVERALGVFHRGCSPRPPAGARRGLSPGIFSNLDHEYVPGYLEGEPTTAWGLLDVVPRASPYTRPCPASRRSQLTVGALALWFQHLLWESRSAPRLECSPVCLGSRVVLCCPLQLPGRSRRCRRDARSGTCKPVWLRLDRGPGCPVTCHENRPISLSCWSASCLGRFPGGAFCAFAG